ncbi:MAG TPA: rhomboid family intramembrane serine protease [Rhizomicrobium sp.]|jgi:membrane associated rhomboid family serine protease|nr:rhomboid family intramembrane serine protease [Rhizomicrobium sp.]
MAFLQEPQRPHQPILRAPAVVIWLLVTIIAAHAARVYLGSNVSGAIFQEFGFIPARYSPHFLAVHHADPGSLLARVVPFFSYVFLHGDFAHLAINCLWLLAFAPIVARRFGAGLFLVFFFMCAAAAAAAHLAFNWESVDPVIGASGAISGLMAAGMRIFTARPDGEHSPKLAPIFSGQILSFTILWSILNVIAGLTGIGTGAEYRLIAWQAHLGGYFAGLLLAGPLDALRRTRT